MWSPLHFLREVVRHVISWLFYGASPAFEPFDIPKREDFNVVILGCGMSGMATAVRLKQSGVNFVILEEASRLGGTWYHNTYPNCACDIPAHLYGYSFAPKWDWSRVYAFQPEILAYLEEVARKYDLYSHIRFNTTVRSAAYDDKAAVWRVGTSAGEFVGNLMVSSLGPLHVPRYPDLDGMQSFAGEAFHSARWKKGFDASGKRVAVIGNAASAAQFVPVIAENAQQLYVFQRTPHWIGRSANYAYWPTTKWLFRLCPPLRLLYRWLLYVRQEVIFSLVFSRSGVGQRLARRMLTAFIRNAVKDPAVAAAVTPRCTSEHVHLFACEHPQQTTQYHDSHRNARLTHRCSVCKHVSAFMRMLSERTSDEFV
eukprot:TRINITY_DN8054_c0_g1_i4.p1 TRINITY_DN8054_c0_g1~~TRINITY_DN8054_c0_g1_i4.p1  ORF type:complete len:369 (+),score=62.04 TRINITY_DN8054_c0_g1_i4:125-1231(+)